jgi:hypothetical protein
LRRGSLQPWRAVRSGIRQAQEALSYSDIRGQHLQQSVRDSI